MSVMPVYCSGCGDSLVHCKCWDIPCDAPLKVAEEARKTASEKTLAEPIHTFKHKQFIAVLKQPFTEEEERVMREYLDFVDERRNQTDSKGGS